MFFTIFDNLCKREGKSATAIGNELGISKTTISYWRNTQGATPKQDVLKKIAKRFGVTVDYLLGNEEPEKAISESDIKFALFHGEGEITDAMYEEVMAYAAQVKKGLPTTKDSAVTDSELKELITLYSHLDKAQQKVLLAAARGIAQDE